MSVIEKYFNKNKNLPQSKSYLVGALLLLFLTFFIEPSLADAGKAENAKTVLVKIGVITPLSGIRADAGEYVKNGLQLAEADINNDPQRKTKFSFVFEDSQYEPRVAVSAFSRLKNIEHVNYIIGPHGSSEALAVAPLAERTKTIIMATGALSDELSSIGKHVFRIIHNAQQEAPFLAQFLQKNMKSDTLHLLLIKTAISPSYVKYFIPALQEAGKKIGLSQDFESQAVDIRPQLLRIKEQHPTDIFMIATPKHAGLIMKQATDLGITAQFYNIAIEGPEIAATAGEAAEGLLYPYSYDSQSSDPRASRFYQEYVKRFASEPDLGAANSYDAAFLLSDCIEHVSPEVKKVQLCLHAVRNYHGVSGVFDINEHGDAIKPLFMKTIKNGKFIRVMESQRIADSK